MALCKHCQAPLEEEAKFCENCGQAVIPGSVSAQPTPPAIQPKPKKGKLWLILTIIALLVIGGVFALWYFVLADYFRMKPVYDAIDNGNLREAYTLLLDMDSKEAAEMRRKFIVVPLKENGWTYTYDENGNILSDKGNGPQRTYTYDKNGNCISAIKTDSDGYRSEYTYTYDEDGNRLTASGRNEYGNGNSYTFTYDDDGKCLSEKCIDEDGDERWGMTYEYDEYGNWVSGMYTDGGESGPVTNTYDECGLLQSRKLAEANGEWMKYTYTYDEYGNILSETLSYDDGWTRTTTYSYTYDDDGIHHTMTYTDRRGGENTGEYQLMYYENGVPGVIRDICDGRDMI